MENINIKRPIAGLYIDLLIKELQVIQDVIKNLDSIIQNSKQFAFAAWGGSLYLIIQHLEIKDNSERGMVVLFTVIIPLLFWMMDFKWRKHILQSSQRMKIISLYLNSDEFRNIETDNTENEGTSRFPLYDPIGWIYTRQAVVKNELVAEFKYDSKYLVDEKAFTFKKLLFYKEAWLFYGTMILLTLVLAVVLIFKT